MGQTSVATFSLLPGQNVFGRSLRDSFALGDGQQIDGIPNLAEASVLARRWGNLPFSQQTPVAAASIQIAIWHYTIGLRPNSHNIPSQAIRSQAHSLIAELRPEIGSLNHACLRANCGEDPADPSLKLTVGDSTESDQIINVALSGGNIEDSFNHYQALDIQIAGAYALVCTGEDVKIDTDKTVFGKSRQCAQGAGRNRTHHYPVTVIKNHRISGGHINKPNTGTSNINIPRQNHDQYVDVSWNITLRPGDVFLPAGRGTPVITAQSAPLQITRSAKLDPADLSGLAALLEGTVVARVTQWGLLGLVALAVLIGVVLNFKELVAATARFLWSPIWLPLALAAIAATLLVVPTDLPTLWLVLAITLSLGALVTVIAVRLRERPLDKREDDSGSQPQPGPDPPS